MHSSTIAVDLAKSVFEVAVTNASGRIIQRHRFTRSQFERFWSRREVSRVVMEACASSHFWGRRLVKLGFEVVLLPPQYVRPYVRRNKTDRTDCEALLEALRCRGIHPVAIKSEDQQAIAALHTVRSQWIATRTARINGIRAMAHEFGVKLPAGPTRLIPAVPSVLEDAENGLPARVRRMIHALWEEIRSLEERIAGIEEELKALVRQEPILQTLLQVPGVGLLSATALYGAIGNIHAFRSSRHLASWLGLTPRESSSGSRRQLGRISKQGNVYLRTLLIHGARAALVGARRRERAGLPLSHLQRWVLEKTADRHVNKATVALANKLARILWAVWYHERSFNGNYIPAAA